MLGEGSSIRFPKRLKEKEWSLSRALSMGQKHKIESATNLLTFVIERSRHIDLNEKIFTYVNDKSLVVPFC